MMILEDDINFDTSKEFSASGKENRMQTLCITYIHIYFFHLSNVYDGWERIR